MKTSAVEDYLRSKAYTLSGNMSMERVWKSVYALKGTFHVFVRHGNRVHYTIEGKAPLLDFYYGKPVYKIRVTPKRVM